MCVSNLSSPSVFLSPFRREHSSDGLLETVVWCVLLEMVALSAFVSESLACVGPSEVVLIQFLYMYVVEADCKWVVTLTVAFESFVVCAKVNCGGQLGSMRGHAFRSEVKRSRIQVRGHAFSCVLCLCVLPACTQLLPFTVSYQGTKPVVQPGDPRIAVSVNFRGGPFLPPHWATLSPHLMPFTETDIG